MAKARQHNEYFKLIVKRTCSCGQKKTEVYSWGEYVCGKWRTVDYVCQSCFPQVVNRLQSHKDDCGCEFNLVGYRGQALPQWLALPEVTCPIN
jgi:hypothetical protein